MTDAEGRSGVVVLLGAGFSVGLGVPTMRRFYEEFCTLAKRRYPTLCATLDQIRGADDSHDDLELLLGRLNQGVDTVLGLPAELTTTEITSWSNSCLQLRAHLMSFIVERCEQVSTGAVAESVGPFVQLLSTYRTPVFTTNYDRVIEMAAETKAIALADGFTQSVGTVLAEWSGDFTTGMPLYKLHGSVTWYVDESDSTILRLDRGYPMPDPNFSLSRSGKQLRPLMVLPTMEKSTLHDPYTLLAQQYTLVLDRASLIIIIGSSLRDEHLANVIRYGSSHSVVMVIGVDTREAAERLRGVGCVAMETTTEVFLQVCLPLLDALFAAAGSDDLELTRNAALEFVQNAEPLVLEATRLNPSQRAALTVTRTSSVKHKLLSALQVLRGCSEPVVLREVMRLAVHSEADVRASALATAASSCSESVIGCLRTAATDDSILAVRLEAALGLNALATDAVGDSASRWEEICALGRDRDTIADLLGREIPSQSGGDRSGEMT